jgi:hypothetical protein
MKMLLIVFRELLAEQVHALMKEHDITAFTEFHNVSGTGETGPTVQFSLSAGANRLILAAIPESSAYRLIDGFTRFRAEHLRQQADDPIPLHVFALPCEQVV